MRTAPGRTVTSVISPPRTRPQDPLSMLVSCVDLHRAQLIELRGQRAALTHGRWSRQAAGQHDGPGPQVLTAFAQGVDEPADRPCPSPHHRAPTPGTPYPPLRADA